MLYESLKNYAVATKNENQVHSRESTKAYNQ